MDSIIYFVLGVLIVGCTAFDIIYTTFVPRGASIISGPVTQSVWRVFFFFSRLTKSKKSLTGAGAAIVFSILITWVLLLWAGNTLIFSSDKDAIVGSSTLLPADTLERVYYAGYTLSTLGNGDFKASTDAWRIYTAFISFSGLISITLAITYIVPVLSAVTARKALSIQIASIGHSPQQILLKNWNGEDFKKLEDQFQSITQDITQQGQMQLSYPVLHYFQHTEREVSLFLNLAALDEAITLLLLYVPEEKRPEDRYLIPLRKAITTFLHSLTSTFVNPDRATVPAIHTDELRKAEVPLLQPDMQEIEHLHKRRRALKAMIDDSGWEWDDISAPVLESNMDLPSMR